ncbi:hypothetical protein [Brevundimonas lutea]|uniref:hypothetical protein n=1 Tax=Brevundimonas lutea TaxID=2293980 RepID=UPI000F03EA58|nr:hypothetical protein [Brevundimonas lutea]
MKQINHVAVAATAIVLAACQPTMDTEAPATVDTTPAASAELVADVTRRIEADENCSGWPEDAGERSVEALALAGGATGVLADCSDNEGQRWRAVYVQTADGQLMRQPLLAYMGAEGSDYEPTPTLPLTWNPATQELTSVLESPEDDAGTRVLVDTIRWRWDGDRFAMVETSRAVRANGDMGEPVVSWPRTPATPDPTAEMAAA